MQDEFTTKVNKREADRRLTHEGDRSKEFPRRSKQPFFFPEEDERAGKKTPEFFLFNRLPTTMMKTLDFFLSEKKNLDNAVLLNARF